MKTGSVEVEADTETVSVHFSPLSNTVYEWVEWMWRRSKRSGCGEYLKFGVGGADVGRTVENSLQFGEDVTVSFYFRGQIFKIRYLYMLVFM